MTTDVGSLRSLTRISGRRRDGLRTLLTRKTPPKGTAGFVAATLADHAEIVAQVGGNHLAADLLGCEAATYGRSAGIAALVDAASDARAQVLHARAGPGRLRVRHRRQLLAPGRPGNPPRSPTTNGPPSTTVSQRSTGSCNGWSPSPRRRGPHHGRSAFPRPRRCSRSSQ